jgi:hypothetical protein
MGGDPAVVFANMLLNALDPKPDIREEAHDVAASYYCNWLTTDEGLSAKPILREAVKALADQHQGWFQQGGAASMAMPPPMAYPTMPIGGGQSQPEAAAAANMDAPQLGVNAQQ